eukprot:g1977.t1
MATASPSGETNLQKILETLDAKKRDGDYVFCTLADRKRLAQLTATLIAKDQLVALVTEREGTTLILERSVADAADLKYPYVASWIEIGVHSSLEAVGLTAAFSTALAKEGISANVVAAYFHDHIFVAKRDADRAIRTLEKLRKDSAAAAAADAKRA